MVYLATFTVQINQMQVHIPFVPLILYGVYLPGKPAVFEDDIPPFWWDMLVSWRVYLPNLR